jgi:hypothetical protein
MKSDSDQVSSWIKKKRHWLDKNWLIQTNLT